MGKVEERISKCCWTQTLWPTFKSVLLAGMPYQASTQAT